MEAPTIDDIEIDLIIARTLQEQESQSSPEQLNLLEAMVRRDPAPLPDSTQYGSSYDLPGTSQQQPPAFLMTPLAEAPVEVAMDEPTNNINEQPLQGRLTLVLPPLDHHLSPPRPPRDFRVLLGVLDRRKEMFEDQIKALRTQESMDDSRIQEELKRSLAKLAKQVRKIKAYRYGYFTIMSFRWGPNCFRKGNLTPEITP